MYANSAKGQLNKKTRRQEGMMSRAHGADGKRARRHDVTRAMAHDAIDMPVILTLSEANGEGSHYPPIRHPELVSGSHDLMKAKTKSMSLRGNDCILGCRGNLFDLFTQGKPFRFDLCFYFNSFDCSFFSLLMSKLRF